MLLDEGGTSPPEVLLQSLNMLTQTHGRERRLSEYTHLLETAGFTHIEGKKTGGQTLLLSKTPNGCLVLGIATRMWQTCLACYSFPHTPPKTGPPLP